MRSQNTDASRYFASQSSLARGKNATTALLPQAASTVARRLRKAFGHGIAGLCCLTLLLTSSATRADGTWNVWSPTPLPSVNLPELPRCEPPSQVPPHRLPEFNDAFRASLALPADGAELRMPRSRQAAIRPVVMLQETVEPPAQQSGAGQSGAATTPSGEQRFGRAPTNDSLEFLRRQSVLVNEGDSQVDAGLVYTLFENDFPTPVLNPLGGISNVVGTRLRRRLLYVPAAIRYGYSKRIQLYGFMPIGYSNTQVSASAANFSQVSSNGGIGDINAGGTFLLCEGCGGYSPTVVSNVGFTAPSGKFSTPLFGLAPGSNLGLGFWGVNADLLFIQQYDPIVVYYGAGYRHLFARDFSTANFQPGEQLTYQCGVGFSVNDRVVLSTQLQGLYITNTRLNGQYAKGSNLEPISLRFAITISRKKRILEPFALIGMTVNAPAAQIGTILTFR